MARHDMTDFVPQDRRELILGFGDFKHACMDANFTTRQRKGIGCRIFEDDDLPAVLPPRVEFGGEGRGDALDIALSIGIARNGSFFFQRLEGLIPHGGHLIVGKKIELTTTRGRERTGAQDHHGQNGDPQRMKHFCRGECDGLEHLVLSGFEVLDGNTVSSPP